ncbi:MAG: hypothetical protein DSZ03_07385 [Sulfurimonas sp.]|nr:MAG: hypothetical protein DSZ03_07385 [Sulfurimonas sp.]
MYHDPRRSKTLVSLQVLYTFLASLLMVYHATQHYNNYGNKALFWNYFKFGSMGEDLLMVLMGFTVFYTSYHLIEKGSGYKEFMVTALSRIFFVYWALIAIPGVIVWLINPALHPSIANIQADELWQTLVMWFGHPRIAIITWVLSHLVFFVVVFGLAILSKKFFYLWYLILGLSLLNLIDKLTLGMHPFGEGFWYRVLSPHNLEFAYGAAAYFLWRSGFTIARYRYVVVAAVLVFFTIGTLQSQKIFDFYESRVIFYGAAAFLLTFSVVNYAQFLQEVPKNIFVKLGEAEYIMLLIHGPILSIVNAHIAVKYSFGWLITLATIAMILTISYLIRRHIEAPVLAYVHKPFET